MSSYPDYLLELGTILRNLPDHYLFVTMGGVATVAIAYRYGYANKLWSRNEAMRVLFRANMQRQESYGHGNRAARREALARMPREELREQDVDALAERYSESRTHCPQLVNFHE